MNILFLNRYRKSHLYGIERWMLRAGRELSGRGHAVGMACLAGTSLHRAAVDCALSVWPFTERYRLDGTVISRLREVLRRQAITVVFVKTWKEVFLACGAGRGLGIRIFCRRGSNLDIQNRLRHRLAVGLCRPHIVVPSAALAREFAVISWMRGRPIHVVPHGVDLNEFRGVVPQPGLPACRFRFIFVGRLSPVKGIDVLLRAWPRVLARAPDSRLLLVGGAEEVDYAALARTLGVADSIDCAGYQENVKPWLAASQALLLPSRREGGGLVALEAMALGLPVIGSDVGGIPDYVLQGRTGVIVPPADEIALAEAMAALALAPERARALGEAGRRRMIDEFSLHASIDRLEQILSDGCRSAP